MIRPELVSRDQLFLAARAAIAAGLAWLAALAVFPHSQPYFAPLAVVLVVQPTVHDSFSRAFQRVAGVVVGVAGALAVSRVLAPSAWSIGLLVLGGLLIGWTARLGPQGVVQVPVSALLMFLVGQVTPGFAGERIVETMIGAGVAAITVLLSPSAPAPDAIMAGAVAPLRGSAGILRAVSTGIASTWTREQADSWRRDTVTLIGSIPTARREHEEFQLSTRWNARARRHAAVLDKAEEAIRSGERIAVYTRSMARALADGSDHARPLPTFSAMLASTASVTDAYATWLESAGTPADRARLAETVNAADLALTRALARAQELWGSDPDQWLTFGATLVMSQRILAEGSRPIDLAGPEPA